MILSTKYECKRLKIAMNFMEKARTKNISKISIKEIMDDTGMSRQKFYTYFEDINDLVRWLNEYNLKDSFDHFFYIDKSVRQSFVNCLGHMYENRRFYKNMISDQGFGPFEEAYQSWCLNAAYMHIGKGRLTEQEDYCLRFYERGVTVMVVDWIKSDMPIPVDTLADCLTLSMPSCLTKYFCDFADKK